MKTGKVLSAALIGKVSGKLRGQQAKLADYLNTRSAGLSSAKQKVFLVLVCLVFGGMSLYFLINAFINP